MPLISSIELKFKRFNKGLHKQQQQQLQQQQLKIKHHKVIQCDLDDRGKSPRSVEMPKETKFRGCHLVLLAAISQSILTEFGTHIKFTTE